VKEWIALGGLATGLFVVALLGALAVQGRLDHEGTRGIPILERLFEAPEDTAADPLGAGDADADADEVAQQDLPRGQDLRGQDRPAAEGSAGEARSPEVQGLFEFPRLDSGMTADDLERILRVAREAEQRARLERARVEAAEAELFARQRDLEDREASIAMQMLRVDQERSRLEERIAEFERDVLLVEQDELRGLREYARTLASFEPVRAAAIVLQEWELDEGRKRIVKVLAVMDPADADAILAQIDVAQTRQVLLERLKIVLEPKGR
jgi:hypothetical protein